MRAELARLPRQPVTSAYRGVRDRAMAYIKSARSRDEGQEVLRDIEELAGEFISCSLRDRLLALRQELSRASGPMLEVTTLSRERALQAVRSLRSEAIAFADDGSRNASRAMERLTGVLELSPAEREVLTKAAEHLREAPLADLLDRLKSVQGALLDRLQVRELNNGPPPVLAAVSDLLAEITTTLHASVSNSAAVAEAALEQYLHDLENDGSDVRSATVRWLSSTPYPAVRMASEFSPSTEALCFLPRAHTRWRAPREYLLWPAWVYRVVAPMPRPQSLNMLEKAVLGLSCAGIRRAELIGPRLHIEPDLAAYTLVDLIERGVLDGTAQPTPRGRELLLAEIAGMDQMRVGHVFQDPITGELWPRFVEHLNFAKREFGSGPYPSLDLGTDGRPRRELPFMYLPPRLSPPPRPAPEHILRASRQHRAGRSHAAERSVAPELVADGEDEELGETPEAVPRISYVDEYPKPVFLTTYLYLPDGSKDDLLGASWYVCDPFGLGASPLLRRWVEDAMEQSDKLREEVECMIGKPPKDCGK